MDRDPIASTPALNRVWRAGGERKDAATVWPVRVVGYQTIRHGEPADGCRCLRGPDRDGETREHLRAIEHRQLACRQQHPELPTVSEKLRRRLQDPTDVAVAGLRTDYCQPALPVIDDPQRLQ